MEQADTGYIITHTYQTFRMKDTRQPNDFFDFFRDYFGLDDAEPEMLLDINGPLHIYEKLQSLNDSALSPSGKNTLHRQLVGFAEELVAPNNPVLFFIASLITAFVVRENNGKDAALHQKAELLFERMDQEFSDLEPWDEEQTRDFALLKSPDLQADDEGYCPLPDDHDLVKYYRSAFDFYYVAARILPLQSENSLANELFYSTEEAILALMSVNINLAAEDIATALETADAYPSGAALLQSAVWRGVQNCLYDSKDPEIDRDFLCLMVDDLSRLIAAALCCMPKGCSLEKTFVDYFEQIIGIQNGIDPEAAKNRLLSYKEYDHQSYELPKLLETKIDTLLILLEQSEKKKEPNSVKEAQRPQKLMKNVRASLLSSSSPILTQPLAPRG